MQQAPAGRLSWAEAAQDPQVCYEWGILAEQISRHAVLLGSQLLVAASGACLCQPELPGTTTGGLVMVEAISHEGGAMLGRRPWWPYVT